MFSTVRYFIKTSIAFLILGILLGLHLIFSKYFGSSYPHPDLVSAHTHVILVGSVMMMIMGVALWFFPRPGKEDKLYKPTLILVTYYFVTISTLLRFFSQVMAGYIEPNSTLSFIIVASSTGQVLGILLFFISMWGRIRSVGSHLREEKGERF
ncbi:MAG TPA: hypothetical protein VFF33_00400 [Ignavibacteriaceae bacterium]|nr:hypothetical protein [Ignavibacteriaceae bacterium]